jgi:Tfp pilus assembly protein PilE
MTTELMVVAVVLAILSGIAAAAVPTFAGRAKRAALASTLAVLQGASDRFFVEANLYPATAQPCDSQCASEVNFAAVDARGQKFVGQYLHSAPNYRTLDYGLRSTEGTKVYFGVTSSGHIFATQVQPVAGEWRSATITVYTQDNTDGSTTLGDIW